MAQEPKRFVKIVIWIVVAMMVLTLMAALIAPALS
jgi:hypothetical protein